MKVLFLCSSRFDYLQDVVYSGLVKCLGQDNIKVAPFNRSFFLRSKIYPKNIGYNGHPISFVKNLIGFDYDLVIVAACKVEPFEKYLNLKLKDVPVVFIDGGDRHEIGGDLDRYGRFDLFKSAQKRRPFDLIFKREILSGTNVESNVHALPIGFNMDRLENVKTDEKKYDVSFWAVESDPIRTQALNLIKDKWDCESNGTTLNQTFVKYARKGDFYLEELQRCKVVLNFRGGGWDTLRYWEVPALGTFMISGKPGFLIPNNFVDDESIVYCQDDLSDLVEKIDYYLKNESERERIAKNSREHLLNYHTDKARAEYILERVKRL